MGQPVAIVANFGAPSKRVRPATCLIGTVTEFVFALVSNCTAFERGGDLGRKKNLNVCRKHTSIAELLRIPFLIHFICLSTVPPFLQKHTEEFV